MSSAKTETYRSSSSDETKKLGHDFASSLLAATGENAKNTAAIILALQGDLGAGKTTFTQGFMKGLGFKKRVASPTFILMRRHKIVGNFSNVFHIDAYRLKKPEQFGVLGLDEILKDPRNIVLIEWPEQAGKLIPKNATWITFNYGKKEHERTIAIKRPASSK